MTKKLKARILVFEKAFAKHLENLKQTREVRRKVTGNLLLGECPFSDFECADCKHSETEDEDGFTIDRGSCEECWQDKESYYTNSDRYTQIQYAMTDVTLTEYNRFVKHLLKIVDKVLTLPKKRR